MTVSKIKKISLQVYLADDVIQNIRGKEVLVVVGLLALDQKWFLFPVLAADISIIAKSL